MVVGELVVGTAGAVVSFVSPPPHEATIRPPTTIKSNARLLKGASRPIPPQTLLKRGRSPLSMLLDRRGRHAQKLGNLRVGPVEPMNQKDDHTLPLRQTRNSPGKTRLYQR